MNPSENKLPVGVQVKRGEDEGTIMTISFWRYGIYGIIFVSGILALFGGVAIFTLVMMPMLVIIPSIFFFLILVYVKIKIVVDQQARTLTILYRGITPPKKRILAFDDIVWMGPWDMPPDRNYLRINIRSSKSPIDIRVPFNRSGVYGLVSLIESLLNKKFR